MGRSYARPGVIVARPWTTPVPDLSDPVSRYDLAISAGPSALELLVAQPWTVSPLARALGRDLGRRRGASAVRPVHPSEILNIVVASWAVRGTEHRHLRLWVPTLHFYFPLGCLAGWKAIYEVVTRPFYWDKTAHGIYDASHDIETDTDPTDSPRYHYIPGDQIKTPSADIPAQKDALKERIELLGHVG